MRTRRTLAIGAIALSWLSGCTLIEDFGSYRGVDAAGTPDGAIDGGRDAGAPEAGPSDAGDASIDAPTGHDAGNVTLRVAFSIGSEVGLGSGVALVSVPSGLACGPVTSSGCTLDVQAGTEVTLTVAAAWQTITNWGAAGCAAGSSCTFTVAADQRLTVTGDARGNLAFVTHATYPIGSPEVSSILGADTACNMAASGAHLPGTYVAFFGDAITTPYAHIGPNDVGWVRLDGRPLQRVGLSVSPAVAPLVHPLDVDETGVAVPVDASAFAYLAPAPTCTGMLGAIASVHTVVLGAVPGMLACGGVGGTTGRVMCLQSGARTTYPPLAEPGPDPSAVYVFVSSSDATTSLGDRAALDARCEADARAASLPGTYAALVGADAPPLSLVHRPDAVLRRADHYALAPHASAMFTTNPLATAPSLQADGAPVSEYLATGFSLVDPSVPDAAANCSGFAMTMGTVASAVPNSAAWPPATVSQDAYARTLGSYARMLTLGCDQHLRTYCIRTD